MDRQEKLQRVKKIRELLGCGVLEAKKYEAYLWENQIELDINSLRHLQWGNPKSQLVTSVRKKTCYECDAEVYELSPRSRCVMCEHRRANVNEKCFDIAQRYVGCEIEELDQLHKELMEVRK